VLQTYFYSVIFLTGLDGVLMLQRLATIEPTLNVQNRAQQIIYEVEMKGQLSDGWWENLRPMGHHKIPTSAKVVVSPGNLGNNWGATRSYNFASAGLLEAIGGRMRRTVQLGLLHPELSLEKLDSLSWLLNSAPEKDLVSPDMRRLSGAATWGQFYEYLDKNMPYTPAQLKRDCNALTKIFRMQAR
jgi:hypothetical protein